MSILKERLNEALMNKKNDINSFVWKGKKVKVGDSFVQEEIQLVNASNAQLQSFYNYCNTMLYNSSKEYPGRHLVLAAIDDQFNRCDAELCLRKLESREEYKVPRYKLNKEIQEILKQNPDANTKDLVFGDISNVEEEFADIPLNLIIEGCIDQLGIFDRKYLKLSFILKHGVWLTQQEINDLTLTEGDLASQGKTIISVIKERLNIHNNIELKINTKGLSFTQLRAMLQLKNKKYSELTTDQLKTLRNRILFNLKHEVSIHIAQWENRKKQLELVAKERGLTLN